MRRRSVPRQRSATPRSGPEANVESLLWLSVGVCALAAAAVLVACCFRLRSAVEFLLAAYLVAWAWLVALVLVLSPPSLVTRAWLLAGIGAGLVGATALWVGMGRPRPPSFRASLATLRAALHRPSLLVLAVVVAAGFAYSLALAFLIPVNDGDALAYHLARAAFWHQEQGLGYIAHAVDLRLNGSPPNAEIGQLGTMVLSGSDRYVALPQLAAYLALALTVAALGRCVGLSAADALFGALAFGSLSIVAIQASSALNDLVVASFLAIAALFALRNGSGSLVLVALAIGLAAGTKFTALFALPTLALVVAVARPVRSWIALALAGIGGLALGSVWYVTNLVETGHLDGGISDWGDQRLAFSASTWLTNSMQWALDTIDMSGAFRPHSLLFLLAAGVLGVLASTRLRTSRRSALALFVAAVATAGVLLLSPISDFGHRVLEKAWAIFGTPDFGPFEGYLELNVAADATLSWFGPLGALLLVVGAAGAVALRLRKRAPTVAVALALAPWVLLLTFAATIVWDPFRGRFLIFGVALAAASWSFLARNRIVTSATAAIGATALVLALANTQGKPSGLGEIWPADELHFVSKESIWGADRPEVQARLRPEEGEEFVYRYLETNVPEDAAIAVAPRANDFLSPFFGPRLSRRVSLASRAVEVDPAAEWLVIAPSADARRCRADWDRVETYGSGWRIERRIARDSCP